MGEYWDSGDNAAKNLRDGYDANVVVRDEKTKKSYNPAQGRYGRYSSGGMTGFLLSCLAERCNVKIAGFRILAGHTRKAKEELRNFITNSVSTNGNSASFKSMTDYIDAAFETMKKEGSASVDILGYDELFVVRGDSNLKTSDGNILDDVDDGAKVADIRKAFRKGAKGKLKTRVMLTKFIDMIA
jgi:hypothetical protein